MDARKNCANFLEKKHLGVSPGGAKDNSPRRKPWVNRPPLLQAPEGRKRLDRRGFLSPLRGFGSLCILSPRLTPWATVFRPSGAGKPNNEPICDKGFTIRLNGIGLKPALRRAKL